MDFKDIDIILASASPRRRELLAGIGVRFEVVPSDAEEISKVGETPRELVTRLAYAKANDISGRYPVSWVLGADTIVVIDSEILGKPRDFQEAKIMLRKLSDRVHTVYTGYAVVNHSRGLSRTNYVTSNVHIRELSDSEIESYIFTGEPMDKAGAYAIQGIGSAIVKSVSGSYTNVVGLPLCEVARDLKDLGIFDFLKPASSHDNAQFEGN